MFGLLVPKWTYDKLVEENKDLREALDLERQRASEASSSMSTTNQLINALVNVVHERNPPKELPPAGDADHSAVSPTDPVATWKDIA